MSRAPAARRADGGAVRATGAVRGYFASSELPLASLVFLLPLIVAYEVGTFWFASDPTGTVQQRIIAFNLLNDFFRLFGANGRYLPPLAVILILLCWHVARRDGWKVNPRHLLGMTAESLLLAIPLLGIGVAATHYLEQLLPLFAVSRQTAALVVLSLGAGIYEELVFRLIAFTVLSFVLVDVLGVRRGWAGLLMVVSSALLFALYHYLGPEPFDVRIFAFRTAAGCYFGGVFLFRGFGITAGAHAAYDIFVVMLRSLL